VGSSDRLHAAAVRGGAAHEVLREPATIRLRCAAITAAVAEGRSAWWRLDRSRLDAVAERVATLTRRRFPDLAIPLHSRWRHFEAGGVNRAAELDAAFAGRSAAERARAAFDLTVVSVLLDAGAGAAWSWREGQTDDAPVYRRSEGLGVASFRAFAAGLFSDDAGDPWRADAGALLRADTALLRALFQVTPGNPLVGLDGRAGLLARLGDTCARLARDDGFESRPGALFDRLTAGGSLPRLDAAVLLRGLLDAFAPVWRAGPMLFGRPAGDCWPQRWAGAATASGDHPGSEGWVPFHKLSQWLAWSLVEPLQRAGVEVTGLDALTGLPEYRNGGLLLDAGVIVPRDARDLTQTRKPGDEFVVEWRALTVTLLDEVAGRVRSLLGRPDLSLGQVLEGGTWAAGREIAAERRSGGTPPFAIDSDGTVF
jgi:hypothetical protein